MKKTMVSFGIPLLIAVTWCIPTFSLLEEHRMGEPVGSQDGWPAGLADVLNRPGRVRGYWINGRDHFFYAGDTKALNQFLEQYAKLEGTGRTLVVHPGRARENEEIRYDWKVKVITYFRDPEEDMLSMEVWLGGQVELDEMEVPVNVEVKPGAENEKSSAIDVFIAAHAAKRKQARKEETPPIASDETSEIPEAEKPVPDPKGPKLMHPAKYKSKRLLFGKLALTEDRSRILSMVLDESKGTRTGHDLLYADLNFNGTFEESEKLTPVEVKRHASWLSTASFAPLNFDVAYNEKAQGIANPCQIVLGYRQYPRVGVAEDFSVTMKIKLRQGTTVWDYSVGGSVKPSKHLKDAVVWTVRAPRMELATQPDGRNKGHLGIALEVSAGEDEFECRKGGQPLKAHVEIKKLDGTVVHEGDDDLGKFRFG